MLIGKNIALRPTTQDDLKLLLEWSNDPEYGGTYDNHWTRSLEQLEKAHQERLQKARAQLYMITRREDGEPLGEIVHVNPFTDPDFRAEEVGYAVHPAHRGGGIATQAACILVNHLFDATPANRIMATVVVGNQASCRVLERAGMTQEGILRGLLFLHGQYADLHVYSILRREWRDEPAYRAQRPEF